MWGAKELDRTETNFWDTKFKGDIIFDEKFSENFHLPINQQFHIDTCTDLVNVDGVMA